MKELLGYRYRIYPTQVQETLFRKIGGCCRALWNTALEQRALTYTMGRQRPDKGRVSYQMQAGELKALKAEFPWFRDVPSQCLQQTLMDLDQAFQRFFKGEADCPRRKKKGQSISFRFPQGFRLEGGSIRLPKAGLVSIRLHRAYVGKLKSATVSEEAGKWHVSLLVEREVQEPAHNNPGSIIGIDAGVVQAFTASDGQVFDIRGTSPRELQCIARLQRTAARRQRGSKRRLKALRRVAALKSRVARRRHDDLHQMTARLARSYEIIAVEDLKIKNMTASAAGTREDPGTNVAQKASLNWKILEVAWGKAMVLLRYKAVRAGGRIIAIDPKRTSQTCSRCGAIDPNSRENQATFCCTSCGFTINADLNAAINIEDRALIIASPGTGEDLDRRGLCGRHADEAVKVPGRVRLKGLTIPGSSVL